MSDDWRIRATLDSDAHAAGLGAELGQGELDHDLGTEAGERVVVSVDDHDVFLYAATREQAERAGETLTTLADHRGWKLTTELRRWHPTAEQWEDPSAPLPSTDAGFEREHAELIAQERSESSSLGFSEYEVRVECASHRATVALAKRLRAEGIPYLRRWRYLLVGATDEESAAKLAERISDEAPAGTTLTVEASLAAIDAERPANPFAVLGGLGG